jgi:UMF1 family MFS transporter
MNLHLPHRHRKREHRAWYWYDFGNSAYAAVVLLAVYSAYFKGTVVGGAEGTRLWGIAVGIAMLVVAVISPVLGAIADFSAAKKRFLFFFSLMAWVFTALMFFVQKGDVLQGMLFFILAEIGYRAAQVFYNAMLPEIATPDETARVSGNGWALGSLGGILALLLILPPMVLLKNAGDLPVRASFVFTAIFFFLSSLPLLRTVPERKQSQDLPSGKNYLHIGFERIAATIRQLGRYRQFGRFILAFLIYNDGILMALNFAAIIGAVLFGLNQTQLILFMILVQATSVVGAWAFGIWGEKYGFRRALHLALWLMVLAVAGMIFAKTAAQFFLIGGLAGFALTGVQSLSRAVISLFAPEGKSAEFYGFFAIAGRTSSFIGPTLYGLLAAGAANYYLARGYDSLPAEQMGQRIAILSILAFLLLGIGLLRRVDEKAGRQEALSGTEAA